MKSTSGPQTSPMGFVTTVTTVYIGCDDEGRVGGASLRLPGRESEKLFVELGLVCQEVSFVAKKIVFAVRFPVTYFRGR